MHATTSPAATGATAPGGRGGELREVTAPTRPAVNAAPQTARMRVLHVAFACDPNESMETRIGWRRATHAARRHDVTVLHGDPSRQDRLATAAADLGVADRLRFVPIEGCRLGRFFCRFASTYYAGYRLWHKAAFAAARELHNERPFDLVHQTTYCGYREPGLGWKLDAPFVWGPVGGTQNFPQRYLRELGPRDAWIELSRNAINAFQLRRSGRVRAAASRARVLLAATNQAAKDLNRALGVEPIVRLETALDEPIRPRRPDRAPGEPLRILWAGRLRAWKMLPLLLKALPQLPSDIDWRLRIVGVGSSERGWRRLAERLGLDDRVDWVGWPGYRATLEHYEWADAFAFTSMRDTSGTGLLEALATGTPLVAVNHQGAADIIDENCALPVSVEGPDETIAGFTQALTRLAREPHTWRRLSDGARRAAEQFGWERQAEELLAWYADAASGQRPTTHGGAARSAAPTAS